MSILSASNATQPSAGFEVRFESLFNQGRALCFPCDCAGQVDMDALPQRARDNYLFARAMVGKDYLPPAVCCLATH